MCSSTVDKSRIKMPFEWLDSDMYVHKFLNFLSLLDFAFGFSKTMSKLVFLDFLFQELSVNDISWCFLEKVVLETFKTFLYTSCTMFVRFGRFRVVECIFCSGLRNCLRSFCILFWNVCFTMWKVTGRIRF